MQISHSKIEELTKFTKVLTKEKMDEISALKKEVSDLKSVQNKGLLQPP